MAFPERRTTLFLLFLVSLVFLLSPISPSSKNLEATEQPRYCIGSLRSDYRTAIVDDFGVPVTEYGYVAGVYIGPQRNPITIAQEALKNYELYKNSNASTALYSFLSNANWLEGHAKQYGNFSVLEYEFPLHYPPSTIQPIWRSAMAQGLAIEVFSKAYELTRNPSYIESADQLLNSFYVDVGKGGVTHKSEDRGWWYELIANTQGIKPRILNGHLFALLGIFEYYNTTGDSSAKYLFDQGITALKNNLSRYDYENGTYSYYDLSSPKKLPPQDYHRLILDQLQELFEITGDPIIKKYLDKWRNFELPARIYNSETCRRTLLPPAPVFKPADYAIRVGPSNFTNEGTRSLYQLDFPEPVRALNLTSQLLDYPAHNITLVPHLPKEIIFSINIEEIHRPSVQIWVIFGSTQNSTNWEKEDLYVVNAGSQESILVKPFDILGKEYLRIKNISVFVPEHVSHDKLSFEVDIG